MAKKKNSSTCSYGILFFLYLIITSDIFGEIVLSNFPNAVSGRSVTTTGAIISGIILILTYILIINYI